MNSRIARVAMFHNEYAQPGGEDVSVQMDTALLQERGIEVLPFRASNREAIEGRKLAGAITVLRSHFNRDVYDRVRDFCRRRKPDIAHVQNFWFALSPSVHAACHAEGVPTVQTLRNYRLLCLNAMLMRNGGPCEDCVGRAPWPGIVHACYQDSRLLSAAVARMIVHNRRRGTWHDDVDVIVALTAFARERYIAGGLPADRIVVRPNTVGDPGAAQPGGQGAVFVGRLSEDKGIDTLLGAWALVPDVTLTIVGDGPLRTDVERAASSNPRIRYLGQVSNAQTLEAIRQADWLVMASRWYEGFPRVIVEAFASGRAVVAPRLGSMASLVHDGVTGSLFEPGSSGALAAAVRHLAASPETVAAMARAARAEFETTYSPARNAAQLLDIYGVARTRFQSSE